MYQLINTQTPNGLELSDYALRVSDGVFVNRHNNEEYLKWLEEGNVPEPAEE
jgi:acyl-ACP thioesterase